MGDGELERIRPEQVSQGLNLLQLFLPEGAVLRPVQAVMLTRAIAALDSEQGAVRQQAEQELTQCGVAAIPFLINALDIGPTLNARRRIENIISRDVARRAPALHILTNLQGVPRQVWFTGDGAPICLMQAIVGDNGRLRELRLSSGDVGGVNEGDKLREDGSVSGDLVITRQPDGSCHGLVNGERVHFDDMQILGDGRVRLVHNLLGAFVFSPNSRGFIFHRGRQRILYDKLPEDLPGYGRQIFGTMADFVARRPLPRTLRNTSIASQQPEVQAPNDG